MKVTDLMIGDWVITRKDPGTPLKITSIGYNAQIQRYTIAGTTREGRLVFPFLIEEIEPIPITPEFLTKNGFSTKGYYEYNEESFLTDFIWRDNALEYTLGADEYTIFSFTTVHELQHLLRLGFKSEVADNIKV